MPARSSLRPFLIALAIAALALSLGGCGRKSGLDLPPQAQAQSAPAVAVADDPPLDRGPGTAVDQALRDEPLPPARSPKRKFILDPLLSSE